MRKKLLFLLMVSLSFLLSCHKSEQEQVIDYLKNDIYSLEKGGDSEEYKLGGNEEERNLHFTQNLKHKLQQEGINIYGDNEEVLGLWMFGTFAPGADYDVKLISIEYTSENDYLVLLESVDFETLFAVHITAFCKDGVVKIDDVKKKSFSLEM